MATLLSSDQPGLAGRGAAAGSTRRSTGRRRADLAQARRRAVRRAPAAGRRDRAAPAPGRPVGPGRRALRAGRPAVPRTRSAGPPSTCSPSWSRRAGRGPATWWRPLEQLARRAALGVAEKDESLDDVEDELFRFGRILDREPRLGSLLADASAPADKRVALLREVLGGRVSPVTATLLEQTVRTPRGRSLDRAAEELSELAAARRDRYVAHVRTAGPADARPGAPARRVADAGSTAARSRCRSSSTSRCSAAWSSGSAAS